MKNKIIYTGLIAFLILCAFRSSAQGTLLTVRDFETWSSFALKYKHTKKLTFGLEQQLRLNNNSSLWRDNFTELTMQIKANKNLRFGIEYRYLRRNDTEGKIQGTKTYNRFALNSVYKKKINRFNLSGRVQYQFRNQFGENMSINTDPDQKIRFKVGTGYNIKKWKLDPEASLEFFKPLFTDSPFEKWRLTIGTEREFKKIGTFNIFYRVEKELNVTYPFTTHIAGINYTYTFKRKKND